MKPLIMETIVIDLVVEYVMIALGDRRSGLSGNVDHIPEVSDSEVGHKASFPRQPTMSGRSTSLSHHLNPKRLYSGSGSLDREVEELTLSLSIVYHNIRGKA